VVRDWLCSAQFPGSQMRWIPGTRIGTWRLGVQRAGVSKGASRLYGLFYLGAVVIDWYLEGLFGVEVLEGDLMAEVIGSCRS